MMLSLMGSKYILTKRPSKHYISIESQLSDPSIDVFIFNKYKRRDMYTLNSVGIIYALVVITMVCRKKVSVRIKSLITSAAT